MGREYGIQDEKIMQTELWWGYLIQEEIAWKINGVDSQIYKFVSKIENGRMWIGFIWLRIGACSCVL